MPANHQSEAREDALRRCRERLAGIDRRAAAERSGFPVDGDVALCAPLFGRRLLVQPATWEVTAEDGGRVSPVEALLVLRHFELDGPWTPAGEWVAYRDLPAGQFYHVALARRTTELLLQTFENDKARLEVSLSFYPGRRLDLGDVSAAVQAIGRIEVALVYRLGDDEFPPAADLLYDPHIARVYTADEVAALATLLCVGLVRRGGTRG